MYAKILKVWCIEDLKIPSSSQWQLSSSHKCCISTSFSLFLDFVICITKSIIIPAIIPISIFIPIILNINEGSTCF